MKATITNALATAGLLALVGAVPLMAQGHSGPGDGAPRAGMMMHPMMEECPMSAQGLLERAAELELSAEQVAQLEALQERQTELRSEMMESMAAVQEVLTPEQREALQERMQAGMGQMMPGMQDREGMHGMMHGMMGGEGHEAAGMMGPHAAACVMMRGMPGGADAEPQHPAHPGEG